jgi:A/G-specific adenine glycosylase
MDNRNTTLISASKQNARDSIKLVSIVPPLLDWYAVNARILPWRSHPTPYFVWVSEIMLQQTRVEAVLPYFERFINELPDIPALAAAQEQQLLKLWEGLGYYSRVRNLHKAACIVMEEYGGALPQEPKELEKLPGIGAYTAGAIASIAYGKPAPAVDGNVLRVIARVTASEENVSETAVKRSFEQKLREIYPVGRAGDFTQALMELGALVCLPNGVPKCADCPLNALCAAHLAGAEEKYPVKAEKKQRKIEQRTVFLILCGDRAAIRQRGANGLLAGLWEFPSVDGALSPQQAAEVLKTWGFAAPALTPLPPAKHIFSHIEWHMTGYLARVEEKPPQSGLLWANQSDFAEAYPLPAAFKSFLKKYNQIEKK